jgi:hypothetical protein
MDMNEISQEVLEQLQQVMAKRDEIEIMIDELKAKEKDNGFFVVIQKEYYTTTN